MNIPFIQMISQANMFVPIGGDIYTIPEVHREADERMISNILAGFRLGFRYLMRTFRGWKTARRLIKLNPDKVIVFSDIGIGDQVFALAYIKQWASNNRVKEWTFLTVNPQNPLYKCFELEESQLFKINRREYHDFAKFCTTEFGYRFMRAHPELFSANVFLYFCGNGENKLLKNPCIFNYSTLIKAVFNLPQSSTPFECLKFPGDCIESLRNHGIMDLQKTVVINPYANSCKYTPIDFFQKIANGLIGRGFTVICSVMGGQEPLQGTLGICLRLDEAQSLCETCCAVIGARSGFMDLIALSDAYIVCVENRDYKYMDLFHLDVCWPQNPHIQTLIYNEATEDADVDRIVNHICEILSLKNVKSEVHHD